MGPVKLDAVALTEAQNAAGPSFAPDTPDATHPPAPGMSTPTGEALGQHSFAAGPLSSQGQAQAQSSVPFKAKTWSLGDAEVEAQGIESPCIPPAMSRRGGQWNLDQFVLNAQLYQSCRSKLFDATDVLSGERVALKLYRKCQLSSLNRAQVEREVNIQINLHHANIVRLYAAWADERNVYLVQEFADGGDLFRKVQVKGTCCQESVVQAIVACFLDVLQYLHGRGIIHRDIKPENILLTSDGMIKLADFGLAIDLNLERPVTRLGTLEYMAPEVLLNPDKVNPEDNKDNDFMVYSNQVDVWAVGVLTYELLVGRAPFEGSSYLETYESILGTEPSFPPWLSRGSRSFIRAALCKEALRRPTTWQLMNHPWLDGVSATAYPAAGMQSTSQPVRMAFAAPALTLSELSHPSPTSIEAGRLSPSSSEQSRPSPTGSEQSHPSPSGSEQSRPSPSSSEQSRPSPTGSEQSRPSPTGLWVTPGNLHEAPTPVLLNAARPPVPPSPSAALKQPGHAAGTAIAPTFLTHALRSLPFGQTAYASGVHTASKLEKASSLPTKAGMLLPQLARSMTMDQAQREQAHNLLRVLEEVAEQSAAQERQQQQQRVVSAGPSVVGSVLGVARNEAADEIAPVNTSAGTGSSASTDGPTPHQPALEDRTSAPAHAAASYSLTSMLTGTDNSGYNARGLSDDGSPPVRAAASALPMLSPVKASPRGLVTLKYSPQGPPAANGNLRRFAFNRTPLLKSHNSAGAPFTALALSPEARPSPPLKTANSVSRGYDLAGARHMDGLLESPGPAHPQQAQPQQANPRSRRVLDYAGMAGARSPDLATLLEAAAGPREGGSSGGKPLQLHLGQYHNSSSTGSVNPAQHSAEAQHHSASNDWLHGLRHSPGGGGSSGAGHRHAMQPQLPLHAMPQPPALPPKSHVASPAAGGRNRALVGRFESVHESIAAMQLHSRPDGLPAANRPLMRSASEVLAQLSSFRQSP